MMNIIRRSPSCHYSATQASCKAPCKVPAAWVTRSTHRILPSEVPQRGTRYILFLQVTRNEWVKDFPGPEIALRSTRVLVTGCQGRWQPGCLWQTGSAQLSLSSARPPREHPDSHLSHLEVPLRIARPVDINNQYLINKSRNNGLLEKKKKRGISGLFRSV